jgi:all-trans-retinol 13,14-reductase
MIYRRKSLLLLSVAALFCKRILDDASVPVLCEGAFVDATTRAPSFIATQRTLTIQYTRTTLHAATTPITATSVTQQNNPWKKNDKSLLHRVYKKDRVPDNVDYIIIGSGIGGLWLAACLAKFNLTSLVLEQHYIAGGLQHTFTRKGYEFVPGLHYIANLELCQPLYEMVADPNMNITYLQAGDSVPADEHQFSSHDLRIGDLPVMHVREGIENVREELVKVFPDERLAIEKFLVLMERAKWQAGQFATFRIFPPWLQFLMSQIMCSSYIKYASMTTDEALSKLTNDGRLKTVLSAFGGDLGESIEEGSFVMQAAVLGHVVEGCHYPEGGPIQFARGLIPPIRQAGGDVLVKARVKEIIIENGRATGVRLANGDEIRSDKGVVSDAGMESTISKLLPKEIQDGPLAELKKHVELSSGGISHVFTFVGFNATNEELGLRSSSFYYIPCNVSKDMDASEIQDFYRSTLLDPNVQDVSAGIVFASAKDPNYANVVMPGKSTAIIFSEAKDDDFLNLFDEDAVSDTLRKGIGEGHQKRSKKYEEAKVIVKEKMIRSLLQNFPHLEPYIDVVEVGTPVTMADYTLRTETLGLRHTPQRMCDFELKPDCNIPGLYFTGQDVSFAGWAGALSGAMVTAQKLLGYTLFDFMNKKTLMRDLGAGEVEDMIQQKVQEGTPSSPVEVVGEIFENAIRHIQSKIRKR